MVTEVNVNATAVESMSDDSAVVLVSASSRVTNAAGRQTGAAVMAVVGRREARRRPAQDVEGGVRTVTADEAARVTDVDEAENGTEESVDEVIATRRRGRRTGNGYEVGVARRHCASVATGGVGPARCSAVGGRARWPLQASRRGCISSSTGLTKRRTRPRRPSRWTRRKTARFRCCRIHRTSWTQTSLQRSHT